MTSEQYAVAVRKTTHPHNRSGQAIAEFIVALVAIMALAAGLLQLTSLMLAQSRTMVNARKEAGIAAVQPIASLGNPEFIRDWDANEEGDGIAYTADDKVAEPSGNIMAFNSTFAQKASTDEGWSFVEQSPSDRLSPMRTIADPSSFFGLVDGYDDETVPLIPAVQSLLYNKESIHVENRVWMTFCGGLYE